MSESTARALASGKLSLTGQLSERTRTSAFDMIVRMDADACLYAFDRESERGMDPPSEIGSRFRHLGMVDALQDLVDDDARAELEALWDRAREYGASRKLLHRRGEPDRRTWWTVLDPAPQDCMLVIVGTKEADPGSENPLPRRGTMRCDAASVVLSTDDNALAMIGLERDEVVGDASLKFVHPDDHELAVTSWIAMLDQPGELLRSRIRYRRATGDWFWAEVTNHNRLHDLGWVEREILDVTEHVDALRDADDKERLIAGLADALPSGIAQFDQRLRLVFANDRWREITGVAKPFDETALDRLLVDRLPADLWADVGTGIATHGAWEGEITLADPGNTSAVRRCRLAVRSLMDVDGDSNGVVVCLDDITDSWRLQQRLVEQATRDRLTGLVNRTAILDHLDGVLRQARVRGTSTAAIFVDLNEFKRVNDVFGHAMGDALLREIGTNIGRSVRPGDVVARHGGDEFLIICQDVGGAAEAMEVARRILNSVTGRYHIDGELIDASASCGVAVDTAGQRTAERMIAEADLAMYERKRNRDQDPGLFEIAMFEEQRDELNRDSALARASEDGSLVLHYQPIVDLATGRTSGYEALLRWNFEHQLIFPDQFIGLAERRGLIPRIGGWVLDEVCRQASIDTRPEILWSLNVSPLQLRDAAFDETVARALDRHGVEPERLALELTEGVLLGQDEPTRLLLNRLSEMGVKLVIDDFGTGYASLDYLRTFPLHGLKIDRCFTADIDRDRTQLIVSTVVGLTEALDVRLVVEGIETPEQAEIVASTGATIGQGYLFGRPAPYGQTDDFLLR